MSACLLLGQGALPVGAAEADEVVTLPPSFIPAGAIGWAEVDLSLPGDQLARADAVGDALDLSGRVVPAPARIAKAIDSAVRSTPFSWARDVLPWSTGRLVIASVDPPFPDDPKSWIDSGLAGLEVTDGPAAAAFLERVRDFAARDNDLTETPRGLTTIVTATPRDGYGTPLSWALVDGWLLASAEPDILGAAVDATSGVAGLGASGAGRISAPGDPLGSAWIDLARLASWALHDEQATMAARDLVFLAGIDQAHLPSALDGWAALQPDGGDLAVRLSLADDATLPEPRVTTLAESMPASTIAYLEVHDAATWTTSLIERALTLERASGGGEFRNTLSNIEYVVGFDVENVLAVVEDVAVGVSSEAGMLQVGAVVTLTDSAEAKRLLETFTLAMRTLSRRTDAMHVEVSGWDVSGVSVAQFSVSELYDLNGQGIPIDGTVSVAIDGDRLLVGTGTFVEDALRGYGDASLLADPRYVEASIDLEAPTLARAFLDVRQGLSVLELTSAQTYVADESVRRELDTASAVITAGLGEVRAQLHATLAHAAEESSS